MTNTIGDIEQADVILVTGSNTTENHSVKTQWFRMRISITRKNVFTISIFWWSRTFS